jgi:ABC-type nickel/cobalt efflux system permease component RcnA
LTVSAAILAAFVLRSVLDAVNANWWGLSWYLLATGVGIVVVLQNWNIWRRAQRGGVNRTDPPGAAT